MLMLMLMLMLLLLLLLLFAQPMCCKKMYPEKQWNFFSHSECSHCHSLIQRLRNTQPDAYQNGLKISSISIIHILFKTKTIYLNKSLHIYIYQHIYTDIKYLCITSSIPSLSSLPGSISPISFKLRAGFKLCWEVLMSYLEALSSLAKSTDRKQHPAWGDSGI